MMFDARMFCIHIAYALELIIGQAIFAFGFPRRKLFVLRCLAVVAVYLLVVIFVPESLFGVYLYISFNALSIFACLVLGTKFMFDVSWKTSLMCAMGTALLQHLGMAFNRLLGILFIPPSDTPTIQAQPFIGTWDYRICFFVAYGMAYFGVWFLLIRKNREFLTADVKSWQLVAMVGISIIVVFVISDYAIRTGEQSRAVYVVPTGVVCIVLLYSLCETGKNTRRAEEERMMRRLLAEEQRRYDVMMSSIETVNRKCHDLKYQIAALRDANKQERNAQIDRLEESVVIYENLARTGNVALDNTIGEKCLVCENKDIRFTYNIDGTKLSFMEPLDIYIIFGNALDNAIECVQKYQKEKREISLTSFSNGKLFKVHIENICDDVLETDGAQLKTHKPDKDNHGFGIRSMRRIAEKYGGNLTATARAGKFCVDMLFQLP